MTRPAREKNQMHYRVGTRAASLIAMFAIVGLGVYNVYETARPTPADTMLTRAGILSVVLIAGWVVWRTGWRPSVRTDHAGSVVIINPLWRWTIPLGAVSRVDSSDGLTVWLKDGREVPAFAFSHSFLSYTSGDKARRRVKRLISTDAEPNDDDKPERRLDFSWIDAALILPFVICATAVLLGAPE